MAFLLFSVILKDLKTNILKAALSTLPGNFTAHLWWMVTYPYLNPNGVVLHLETLGPTQETLCAADLREVEMVCGRTGL